MNNLMKFVALASVAVMAGCVGNLDLGNDKDDDDFPFDNNDDFVSRAGTLPSNFTNRAVGIVASNSDTDTKMGQFNTLANDYLTSVVGELNIVDDIGGSVISGEEEDSLKSESGVLMVFSEFVGRGNIFVGIFSTTDVGPAFTDANPTATFEGFYTVKVIGTVTASDYYELGAPITLNADFNAGTLSGSGTVESTSDEPNAVIGNPGSILTVNGTFTDTTLSGNVNFAPPNASRSYDAPLTGLVGQNGAVGAFANSANNDNNRDYAFGGGFLVTLPSK